MSIKLAPNNSNFPKEIRRQIWKVEQMLKTSDLSHLIVVAWTFVIQTKKERLDSLQWSCWLALFLVCNSYSFCGSPNNSNFSKELSRKIWKVEWRLKTSDLSHLIIVTWTFIIQRKCAWTLNSSLVDGHSSSAEPDFLINFFWGSTWLLAYRVVLVQDRFVITFCYFCMWVGFLHYISSQYYLSWNSKS